jgi:DNA-directed RNA polymerase specialized sigma24 family protein
VAHLLGRTYKATESLLSRARLAFQEALARLEGETA